MRGAHRLLARPETKSVASVSSAGVVTAKKAGTATITAERDGYTASCKVTVTSRDNAVFFNSDLDEGDPYDVYYHEDDPYAYLGVKNSTYYYLVFTGCANIYDYDPAED